VIESPNPSQTAASLEGLSTAEVKRRLAKYGKNEIPVSKKLSIWRRCLNQFHNILIYILLIAALITGFLQFWMDMSYYTS